jgi:hypothetical protein
MLALRMAHAHTIADEDYKELVRQMHALPAKVPFVPVKQTKCYSG